MNICGRKGLPHTRPYQMHSKSEISFHFHQKLLIYSHIFSNIQCNLQKSTFKALPIHDVHYHIVLSSGLVKESFYLVRSKQLHFFAYSDRYMIHEYALKRGEPRSFSWWKFYRAQKLGNRHKIYTCLSKKISNKNWAKNPFFFFKSLSFLHFFIFSPSF